MSAILDQIKRNAVPAAVLRTASKGALPLPGPEMIEILVYLTQNPIFAKEARMTLAGWDLSSAIEAVSSPDAPPEVLGYYWSEQNRRRALMPTLIENPAITDNMLLELAGEAPREIISMLVASPRVRAVPGVVESLSTNPRVLPAELQALHGEPPLNLTHSAMPTVEHSVEASPTASQAAQDQLPEFPVVPPTSFPETIAASAPSVSAIHAAHHEEIDLNALYPDDDPETQAIRLAWEKQYAAEIAAAEIEPFELVSFEEETSAEQAEATTAGDSARENEEASPHSSQDGGGTPDQSTSPAVTEDASSTSAIKALSLQRKAASIDARKLTIMQRLGRMRASERIKTAFIGGKEERSILIRDRARIVQNAVLSSPKMTDSEVEVFAAAKNLDENVLREIARSRRFMKNYPVVRNLATNPKTPLDVAMPLVKMLMVFDLKSLQKSKSVSEIIRKMAQKYYQEKATSGGKTKS
jgi:hypothetical protein